MVKDIKLLSIVFLTLCMICCKSVSKESSKNQLIGGHRDAHGCLSAAGYQWSEIKQECVRIFEIGTHLIPISTKEGEAIFAAYIYIEEEKAELFIDTSSAILIRTTSDTYKDGIYEYDVLTEILYTKGVKTHAAQ